MTSQDFIILGATFSLIAFTVLGAIALVYLIAILRRIHLMMDTFEQFFSNVSGGMRDAIARVRAMKETADLVVQGLRAVSGIAERRHTKHKKEKSEE